MAAALTPTSLRAIAGPVSRLILYTLLNLFAYPTYQELAGLDLTDLGSAVIDRDSGEYVLALDRQVQEVIHDRLPYLDVPDRAALYHGVEARRELPERPSQPGVICVTEMQTYAAQDEAALRELVPKGESRPSGPRTRAGEQFRRFVL